jgi:glycosyltransferase involved in cell wall biosynthesis
MPLLVSVLPTDIARGRGGGERCAFEVHRHLRTLLPGWDAVALGASTAPASSPLPDGWTNIVRRGRRPPHPQDALSLRALLRQTSRRADLIVAHQWWTYAMASLRTCPHRGTLIAIDHGGGHVNGVRLARLPLPPADLVAIQSEFEKRVTPLRGRRVCNMRGGIVDELFSPPAVEERTIDFLLVGRFLPHKGHREFQRALPPGAVAMLIGPSGTYEDAYRDEVMTLAADRGVEVRLDLTDAELRDVYRQTRYVVQVPIAPPGTAPELLGLTPLEGMACGAVPICPRHGASAEFARDGETGLQYEDQDIDDLGRVLAAAYSDESRRRTLAAAALVETRRWTWRAAAEVLVAQSGIG